MKKRNSFIYWALDLLALLLIGVVLLVDYLHLSLAWEETLQIGVIVVVYGLIILWWRAHPKAMVPPRTPVEPRDARYGIPLTPIQTRYRQVINIHTTRKG